MERSRLLSFSRREAVGMIGLVVLGLGLRLYWVHHNRMWENVTVFEPGTTALRLVTGHGFTGQYHYAPDGPTGLPYPFYTLFLAAWYGAVGAARFEQAHYPIMLVQCAVGSLFCVLTYVIARRLFNTPIAVLSAVGVTLDYFLAVICGYISQTVWHVLAVLVVVCAAIVTVDRTRVRGSVLTGLAVGVGTFVKTTVVLMLPAAAWWVWRRVGAARARRAVLIVAMGTTTALVLLPLVVRHYLIFGRWGVLNTCGGLNFWQGNCDYANGGTYASDGTHIQKLVPERLQQEVARLNEARGAAVFYREGWRWARSHPWRFVDLRVRTVFYAYYNQNYWMVAPRFAYDHRLHLAAVYGHRQGLRPGPDVFPHNPVLKWATVVLVTWCLVGVFAAWPWWRGHSLLLATIVVQTLVYSFYHADVDNRFRMPFEPFLLMYGAALVWQIACRVRARAVAPQE